MTKRLSSITRKTLIDVIEKGFVINELDEDDVIEASSYGAIGRDFNDKVSVIVKDNQITTLVIEYLRQRLAPSITRHGVLLDI